MRTRCTSRPSTFRSVGSLLFKCCFYDLLFNHIRCRIAPPATSTLTLTLALALIVTTLTLTLALALTSQAWKAGADANNPGGLASTAAGVDSSEAEEMWVAVKKQLDGGGDKSEGVKVAVR